MPKVISSGTVDDLKRILRDIEIGRQLAEYSVRIFVYFPALLFQKTIRAIRVIRGSELPLLFFLLLSSALLCALCGSNAFSDSLSLKSGPPLDCIIDSADAGQYTVRYFDPCSCAIRSTTLTLDQVLMANYCYSDSTRFLSTWQAAIKNHCESIPASARVAPELPPPPDPSLRAQRSNPPVYSASFGSASIPSIPSIPSTASTASTPTRRERKNSALSYMTIESWSWQHWSLIRGIRITGTVRNNSSDSIWWGMLYIEATDFFDRYLGADYAVLRPHYIRPGETATFEAHLWDTHCKGRTLKLRTRFE